jgi:D-aminopeptidase
LVIPVGSVTVGDGPWFWAAPFEIDGEFGGRGLPPAFAPDMLAMRLKGAAAATATENTTLAVVVTDAILTKPQARRLAMIAQTGFARAIYPVHAPLDGDVLFAARHRARRVRGDRASLPRRAAGLEGSFQGIATKFRSERYC